ncbi:hypothetical protein [Tsuneonella sp. HG222]
MINSIIVGSGTSRTQIDLVRDLGQRRSAAGALKGHLFPTDGAHFRAMRLGKKRAAAYRAEVAS